MFTFAQFLRLIEIFRELYMIVESVPFTARLPYTLISWLMVLYILLYVYTAMTRFRRLVVAQRENSQLRHEIVHLRGLAYEQDGSQRNAVRTAVPRQIRRLVLSKVFEHMNEETSSVKKNLGLLQKMDTEHKDQMKTMQNNDAAAVKLLEDNQKEIVKQRKKERKTRWAALQAAHKLAYPNPTAWQREGQTVVLHKRHMRDSNADELAQSKFDTDMMDLRVEHKLQESHLVDRQRSEKRAFEDKCLHEHSRNMRARY